jgi:hypothetical protein
MNFRSHHIAPTQKAFQITPGDRGVYAFLSTFILIFAGLFINLSEGLSQVTLVTGSPQSATTNSATLTINKPSGLAVGDLMLVSIIQSDNDGANGGDLSNASLAGWSLVDGAQTGVPGSGGNEWWGTVLYKVATAGDVTATNFTFTVDGDADDSEGSIIAFRGVDVTGGVNATGGAGGPFDVDPGTINVTNSLSTTLTATTTTTANNYAAMVMFGFVANNSNLSAWQLANGPLSLTEIYDLPYNPGGGGLVMGMGASWALRM